MPGYENAARLLPGDLRAAALALPPADRREAREFRLRIGQTPAVTFAQGEKALLPGRRVTAADLFRVTEIAAEASPYAAAEGVRQGYIAAAGGVRVGLCGRMRSGGEGALTAGGLTSAAIRIPREVKGCGEPFCSLPFASTLILSPPGAGKTTLLRDMVRRLSVLGLRVGLCDERGEISAPGRDGFGFDLGPETDVLTECPKDAAALQLLRTMNPQVIAMDEITAGRDAEACCSVAGCGTVLLATAHGESVREFRRGKLCARLSEEGVFHRIICIRLTGSDRTYTEELL